MAKYPPQIGEKWKLNNQYFRITGIDSQTNDVLVEKIDESNNISPAKPISKKQWEKREYVLGSGEAVNPSKEESIHHSDYVFRFSDDGRLSILKDGKSINEFDLRGPEGKPGKDGMPGQNGAPGQPGQDGAPGKNGRDGAPGKDGAPGPEGKQGPEGPKGKDGIYWLPEISKDGNQLRFVNRNDDTEYTEWYDIKGIKGDTGDEGPRGNTGPVGPVYTPRVNADGTLSWTNNGDNLPNPTPINIKGERGEKGDEGVTYQPMVKDGILYWTNNQGKSNPDPIRIAGPQGDRGDTGRTGLSAYEIWRKAGNLGTEQDFLESLKGPQGVPAPPASFSYKDVEDYTCKVQKIDTKLIVKKGHSSETPEQIIASRINEIKQLRNEGAGLLYQSKFKRKKNRITNNCAANGDATGPKRKIGWFKRFTWWCAGADSELLAMCPGDHSKYVGVGTVILFTALMAWFSSFIAMRLVFEGNCWMPPIFATFWAAMIFFLDRFITNTMYSDGKVSISKKEFFSGLPRIIIAIFLGIVISAPLELKIFEKEIDNETNIKLRLENTAELRKERDLEIKRINDSISNYESKVANIIENQSRLPFLYKSLEKEKQDRKTKRNQVTSYKTTPTPEISGYQNEEEWQSAVDDVKKLNEAKQKAYEERLNIASEPYDTKIKQLEKDILELLANPEQYNAVIQRFKEERDTLIVSYNHRIAESDTVFLNRIGLRTRIKALHNLAMEGYKPWKKPKRVFLTDNLPMKMQVTKELDSIATDSTDVTIKGHVVKKENSQIEEVVDEERLIEGKHFIYEAKNGFWDIVTLHSMWYYLFSSPIGLIMLLFILIDISPVLYKMMLADGKYDNYLHQEKLLAQDRIRLSLSKMLKKLDESELKRVAPFIMGDIYDKMAVDSYLYKDEDDLKRELEAQVASSLKWYWRLWPINMLIGIFWKKDYKPAVPIIEFETQGRNRKEGVVESSVGEKGTEGDTPSPEMLLEQTNNEVFKQVLEMKKRIILASYRRWYKTQHDCIICDPVDDENRGCEPFEEDNTSDDNGD